MRTKATIYDARLSFSSQLSSLINFSEETLSFYDMPPKRPLQKQHSELSKTGHQGTRGKGKGQAKDADKGEEPAEIDIEAVVKDLIAQSNARIVEAMQARQDQLVEKMMKVESPPTNPRRR